MKRTTILTLLIALASCAQAFAQEHPRLGDIRDLRERLQLYFVEPERNEDAETLITFRITDLAEYHSGDTTNDFIYVFDAIAIRSESPSFQKNEKIRAYYQKRRLGRELRGPKEMKSDDIITISAKAIGDISIESILIEINGSNQAANTTEASADTSTQ